jgi:putative Mn2+ efflux pump MntP
MVSLITIATVALLHMLIPSHWLCFVVVGRAQGWRTRKTLAVAAVAGLLHVLSTVAVGLVLGTFVREFVEKEEATLEKAGALLLIGLGALYLLSHLLHAGHHHEHDRAVSEKTAFVALLFSLVLSPCSAAIPVLVASETDPQMVALTAAVLLVTTVGGMLALVGLASLGIEKLRFAFFDRYEKIIMGSVLCLLGALVLLLHRH